MGPALIRLEGWERRLNELIESRRETPFAWGRFDCVIFVCDAIEALTGVAVWAPDWTNEDEALRVLVGLRGLEAAVSAVLGEPHENWRLMRRGDVALAEPDSGRKVLAVCAGATLVGPSIGGMESTPASAALRVWRVG